jgi:NADH-quinone oxidoreductase subunit G
MTDDTITIEIDGQPFEARKGQMLIEVTDANNIYIPRFCYHHKLSVAANCRMCLIEVEKAPKPLPACATPVMDGMKAFTKSSKAISAQKAVMEFLLINHPLDCPICDQGGECELQDLAIGYGRDISRYQEKKRVVKDKNIGPLVQTDMTRCIHCTRCVRFGDEIAGLPELGATGRGEQMEIGTYIEKSMVSELSGNVIDLCPVGALTSKPFRFSARTWEMTQRDSIAPHDAVGSNIHIHTTGNYVKRVVPAENEHINEVWLSDRDRFSYEGLYNNDRLLTPMIKQNGEWKETKWETALAFAKDRLQAVINSSSANQIGALASPTSTLEELYLLQKLMRGIGCPNIDHRLRQRDFSDQDAAPVFPWLGQSITELEQPDVVLLVGSNVRKEQPIINHRLRKAVMRGCEVSVVNLLDYDFNFNLFHKFISSPADLPRTLAAILKAINENATKRSDGKILKLFNSINVLEEHKIVARQLMESEKGTILIGNLATAHPEFSTIRALAGEIAKLSNISLGYLSEAANTSGAWLSGVLPHRETAAVQADIKGLDAYSMLDESLKAYVLLSLEPELDCWDGNKALHAMNAANCVISFTAYRSEVLNNYADVMLPIALFAETSGTYINNEGRSQSFNGVVTPPGESRPAWKVLRVLGNLFELDKFDYNTSIEIRDELQALIDNITPNNQDKWGMPSTLQTGNGELQRITDVPMNAIDPLTRHAESLQQTNDVADGKIHISAKLAQQIGVDDGGLVKVDQDECSINLPVMIDARVPSGCVQLHAAQSCHAELGAWYGNVKLTKV